MDLPRLLLFLFVSLFYSRHNFKSFVFFIYYNLNKWWIFEILNIHLFSFKKECFILFQMYLEWLYSKVRVADLLFNYPFGLQKNLYKVLHIMQVSGGQSRHYAEHEFGISFHVKM